MRRCQDVSGVEDDPATPEASHDNPDHISDIVTYFCLRQCAAVRMCLVSRMTPPHQKLLTITPTISLIL
ncbi:hypothetical protein RRG08_012426 [Elysia crispata]|uniref:Uncharacterized protein n=1 Tax=Elysia crispata TaxID=231223 RepID=A0AAE1AEI6_9GAST|nr:hypothetical protein RRG08_012426 [Elysia crispata]